MAARDIISSGGFEKALYHWEHNGGGSKGRAKAKQYLEREYPNESSRSIEAILNRVRESIDKAKKIERGGPSQRQTPLQRQDLPNIDPLEREEGKTARTGIVIRIKITAVDPENDEIVYEQYANLYGRYGETVNEIMDRGANNAAIVNILVQTRDTPRFSSWKNRVAKLKITVKIISIYTRIIPGG